MRSLHTVLIEAASRPGVSSASRRSVFGLVAAAPLAFGLDAALAKNPGRKKQKRRKQQGNQNTPSPQPGSASDLEVLNYALTLEHLEYAFYRDALGAGGFTKNDFQGNDKGYDPSTKKGTGYLDPQLYERLLDIRDHEKTHVDALMATILQLGGDPVEELCYDFGYATVGEFLGVAQALENTGVSAYDGAIASITSDALQTTAATIATVEARHASYLNLINGDNPFPAAFDTPLTMEEVLAIAGPFIIACP